jgi:hypothetical protein
MLHDVTVTDNAAMLIETLFERGIMKMSLSRCDPSREVGVFAGDLLARVAAEGAMEIEKFQWIAGEWEYDNRVPATRLSPSYQNTGRQKFAICEKGGWVCMVSPDGS